MLWERRAEGTLILLPVLRSVIHVPARKICWLPSAFIRVAIFESTASNHGKRVYMTTFPNLEMERNRTKKRVAYFKKLPRRRQNRVDGKMK